MFKNEFDYVQKWFDKNSIMSANKLITDSPVNSFETVEDKDLKANYSYSVYLNDVPNIVMQNGQIIKNAFNAILARGASNINMYSASQLANNGIGVNMIGELQNDKQFTPASGRFTMDCASLIKNVFGLLGRNVVLDVDELLNSNNKNFNTFIQWCTSRARFFICLLAKYMNFTLLTPQK